MMDELVAYFTNLNALGPKYNYFPDLTKSVFVVKPGLVEMAREKLGRWNLTDKMGHRYLGGFVGYQE